MQVKAISITKAIDLPLTPEELIVYIARVSNPSNQMNTETAPKLLSFLMSNKHWSPFDMVDLTFEIVTSRAIAAQILRHRSFCFQEFSQRYAEVTDFEEVQLRKQAKKNRQSSVEVFNPVIKFDSGKESSAITAVALHIKRSEALYKKLISEGVAKECARMVLPLTTQTRIYMKGSVRSWIHYLAIRLEEHTQYEHRCVAQAIELLFAEYFPDTYQALTQSKDE